MNTNQQKRIGNTILYLCEKVKNMPKTKLLKLLYLLEERSIRETGTPFLNIDFEVWKLGPVPKEIFISIEDVGISQSNDWLNNYINCKRHLFPKKTTYLTPKTQFDDAEFSDIDINLMDNIINEFGNKNVDELIAITHREDRPWYKIAKEKNLLEKFEAGEQASSDYKIEFKELLKEDPYKLSRYESYQDFLQFSTHHHS
jgi:uncharacterized phage-associated protein